VDASFADQSTRALNLCAFSGAPDLSELTSSRLITIYAEKTVEVFPGVTVRLGIIGESHFWSLRSGDFEFMEILACVELPPLSVPSIRIASVTEFFAKKGNLLAASFPPLEYSFRSHVVSGAEEAAAGLANFLRGEQEMKQEPADEPADITLRHTFPGGEKPGAFLPQTALWFSVPERGMYVLTTAHAYPNENAVVFSNSVICRPSLRHKARSASLLYLPGLAIG